MRGGPNLPLERYQIMDSRKDLPFGRHAVIASPLPMKSPHLGEFNAFTPENSKRLGGFISSVYFLLWVKNSI